MIDENKYRNEMRSLGKAKAPRDFLSQVDKRIGQRKKVFFPAPMRLATAVAAVLIIFTVYKVSQQPMQVSYIKEPGTKTEMMKEKKMAVAPKVMSKPSRGLLGAVKRMAKAPPAEPEAAEPMKSLAARPVDDSLADVSGAGMSRGAAGKAAAPMMEEKARSVAKAKIDPFSSVAFQVAEIDLNLDNYEKDEKEIPRESTDGATATRYFKQGNLIKVQEVHFGETGKLVNDYYFLDNKVIYVAAKDHYYNRPYYFDEEKAKEMGEEEFFDPAKTRVELEKYYIRGNHLVEWLGAKGQEVSPENEDFKQRETELLQQIEIFRMD